MEYVQIPSPANVKGSTYVVHDGSAGPRKKVPVSVATGSCIALMSVAQLAWLLFAHQARAGTIVRTVLQGPMLGAAAAGGAMLSGTAVAAALLKVLPIGSVRGQALVECLITTALYAVVALAIVRVTSAGALRDAVLLLPSRPRALATRLLQL